MGAELYHRRRPARCCPPALMAPTEHRSVAQAIGYFQAGEITHNPAARLLDDGPGPAR